MSSVLAWFMHPQMEHGLGFEFLNRFVKENAKNHKALQQIGSDLSNRLRGDNTHVVGIEPEEHVTSED